VNDKQAADLARSLHGLRRQLLALTGLVEQQSDFTVEALKRAGWQSDAEAAQQAALHKALQLVDTSEPDVIVGPWTGEVGFELLYWIPFLNWLVAQGFDSRRMVIVSRGGAAAWYGHLTSRYVDILDVMTPAEFQRQTAGHRKQLEGRSLEREVVDQVRTRLQLAPGAPVLHPSAMYRLFQALWRRRASVDLVESFTVHTPIELGDAPAAVGRDDGPSLPDGYLTAKFYFSKAFPDTTGNRRAVAELLRAISQHVPVALLVASTQLDDHADFTNGGGSGVYVVDTHRVPRENLTFQSRVIARSAGFLGTYGGFSYLAPFLGVRSLSLFSRRDGFEAHHLELANRVFDRLLPGGFLAIDRRALDLVAPLVRQWPGNPRPEQGLAAGSQAR
jgi:hypothetical protein